MQKGPPYIKATLFFMGQQPRQPLPEALFLLFNQQANPRTDMPDPLTEPLDIGSPPFVC
jgi:hypothetical protein